MSRMNHRVHVPREDMRREPLASVKQRVEQPFSVTVSPTPITVSMFVRQSAANVVRLWQRTDHAVRPRAQAALAVGDHAFVLPLARPPPVAVSMNVAVAAAAGHGRVIAAIGCLGGSLALAADAQLLRLVDVAAVDAATLRHFVARTDHHLAERRATVCSLID